MMKKKRNMRTLFVRASLLLAMVCCISCANYLNDACGFEQVTGKNGTIEWSFESSTNTLKVFGTKDNETAFSYELITDISTVKVKKIFIGNNISSLADNAFIGFTSLNSLTIPATVLYAGKFIISGLNEITEINISANVSAWDSRWSSGYTSLIWCEYTDDNDTVLYVFGNDATCYSKTMEWPDSSATKIIIAGNMTGLNIIHEDGTYSFQNMTKVKTVIISAPLYEIATYTFAGCKALDSVTLPDSWNSIDANAFQDCTSLVKIDLPVSLFSLKDNAFSGCTSLASIILPDSLSVIGSCVFQGCTSLSTADISCIAAIISANMFYGCRSLTQVILPDVLFTIDASAFENCFNLSIVSLGLYLNQIGKSAFKNCCSIQELTIPASVTIIDEKAFSGWSSTQKIKLSWSTTDITVRTLTGIQSNETDATIQYK